MSVSLGNTDSNDISWLHGMVRYSVSLAAAALALTVLVGFNGGLKGEANSRPGPVQTARTARLLQAHALRTAYFLGDARGREPAPQGIYYLVSSQAGADWAAFLDGEAIRGPDRASINAPEPRLTVYIFLVTTEAQEEAALHHIAATDAEGVPFTLVDLRDR